VAKYGERLVCVRYRYDPGRKKRLETVEIIAGERDWEPPPPRFADDQIVGIRVAFEEVDVRERVKQAGGTWHRPRRVWQLASMATRSPSVSATGSSRSRHLPVDARDPHGNHLHADAAEASR
jgi:hypothetical protein